MSGLLRTAALRYRYKKSALMDRTYAYLRVVGHSDTVVVTEVFGVQPAKSWNVGDRRQNGSIYDFSHWQSTEFEGSTLDDGVHALLDFIEEVKLDFSQLPNDFVATIQCVGYHDARSPGFHFDADLVQRLGRLGVRSRVIHHPL
jgi:hypothetical protein